MCLLLDLFKPGYTVLALVIFLGKAISFVSGRKGSSGGPCTTVLQSTTVHYNTQHSSNAQMRTGSQCDKLQGIKFLDKALKNGASTNKIDMFEIHILLKYI